MIVIKGVPRCEKEALEDALFVRNVTYNQQVPSFHFDDNILYDITLKSNIQITSRNHGIELFTDDVPVYIHNMDECMFMEVIIT